MNDGQKVAQFLLQRLLLMVLVNWTYNTIDRCCLIVLLRVDKGGSHIEDRCKGHAADGQRLELAVDPSGIPRYAHEL